MCVHMEKGGNSLEFVYREENRSGGVCLWIRETKQGHE